MHASLDKTVEKELVEGCINRDRKVQKKLYDLFSSRMYGVCLRYSNDRETARDIMQEGFINIYKNIHKFRFTGSLEGWMKRIMINKALENYRSNTNYRNQSSIEFAEDQSHSSWIVENISKDELLKVVQKLAPGYRAVFNMYAIEGFSHAEIAEMMEISESTSKSQLSRARQLLQAEITKLKMK